MTDAIQTIRDALAAGPTPGKWKAGRHGVIVGGPLRHYVNGSAQSQIAMVCATDGPLDEDYRNVQEENAAYIAACNPEAMTALLARLDKAEAELATLLSSLEAADSPSVEQDLPYHIGVVEDDTNGHPWKRIAVFWGDSYLASLPEGTKVYSEPQMLEYFQKSTKK